MSLHSGRLFGHAQRMLDNGQVEQAMDALIRLLGENPDDGDAHALLSLCLVRRKRLHAAKLEAQRAAELEPESVFAHLAMGAVLAARREFVPAEQHLIAALELDPESDSPHAQLARLYTAWSKSAQAMVHAVHACELAAGNPENWALRGSLDYSAGDRAGARLHATTALEIDPEHSDALVLIGHCDLAEGDVQSAQEHAVWALQADPTEEGALTLLGAIKARRSPLLGLWWRFQSLLSAGSNRRMLLLLVGIYLLYRIVLIALADNGMEKMVAPLSIAWLAFCAYTWFAPAWFWKSVRREMQTVSLRDDY